MCACGRARIRVFHGRRGPSGKKGKYKKERSPIVFQMRSTVHQKKWGVLVNKSGVRSNKKMGAVG